jgi:tetratricopeptide (TPR) repeat protein
VTADKKDFKSAEADLAKADAVDPFSSDTLRTHGWIAEKKNAFASASEWYGKAIQKNPKDVFALVHQGQVLVTLGRDDEALAPLNAALAINPTNTLALMNRAMAELNKGDHEAADRDAKAAAALSPDIPAAYEVEGSAAEAKGDYPLAVTLFTKALALGQAPGRNEPYLMPLQSRAHVYSASGQYDKALADTDELIKLGQSTVETRLMRANIYSALGKPAAALAEADLIVTEHPNDDFAAVAAAKIYAAGGQRVKAMAAFDKALKIHQYGYIYLNREQVRPYGDIAGRMADLDAGLKAEPENEDIPIEKARLLARTGDFKGALAILDRVKPDLSSHELDIERAVVLFQSGRTDEAKALLGRVRAQSLSAEALNSLCWEQATAGILLDEAVEDCRRAVKLNPTNGAYLDSLGMALLKQGKLDEALAAYTQAIGRKTGAASLMGRAFVYLRKGDQQRAEADAGAARKVTPGIDDVFAGYGLEWPKAASSEASARLISH